MPVKSVGLKNINDVYLIANICIKQKKNTDQFFTHSIMQLFNRHYECADRSISGCVYAVNTHLLRYVLLPKSLHNSSKSLLWWSVITPSAVTVIPWFYPSYHVLPWFLIQATDPCRGARVSLLGKPVSLSSAASVAMAGARAVAHGSGLDGGLGRKGRAFVPVVQLPLARWHLSRCSPALIKSLWIGIMGCGDTRKRWKDPEQTYTGRGGGGRA